MKSETKAKRSPTPWTSIERDGDNGITITGATHERIAFFHAVPGYSKNAELFIAAPQLAEACKAALEAFEAVSDVVRVAREIKLLKAALRAAGVE